MIFAVFSNIPVTSLECQLSVFSPRRERAALRHWPIEIQRSAFSLVEVVIAIAVLSFCLVTIIYLLGVGLKSSQNSGRDSSLVAVLHTADAMMRANTTNTLDAIATTNLYFDLNGNNVASESAANFNYLVTIQRVSSASVSTLTAVSDSTATPSTSPGVTNVNRFFLWKMTCAYPPPSFPQTNILLMGGTSYDP